MSLAAPLPIKYTSTCQEDQRLSTKGKIASKYCNIKSLKTPGSGSITTPPLPRLFFQGGSKNLRVRPRVKKNKPWEFTQSERRNLLSE